MQYRLWLQLGNGLLEVTDSLLITFSPSPNVNAGTDQIMCSNNAVTSLSGTVAGGASTGTWSNGLGTFQVDNNDLNASYTPTVGEIASGSVELYLTSSDHGSNGCNSDEDTVLITFTPSPTVDAGNDETVCANDSEVSLSGSYTIASGIIWSSTGDGNFETVTGPMTSTNLNTSYFPSANDITAGTVKIYLTTTGSGTCVEVVDSLIISITPSPTVDAGSDYSVCSNNADITLNAISTVATAWEWTTGGSGSFNPNENALNTIYTPTQLEIDGGSIVLYLETTSQGNCLSVNDSITISFTASPVVDAGLDQIICANNEVTTLNGSVTIGATTGTWSNGLGTYLVDNNDLNANYTPTTAEIASGSVLLYLTSLNHGSNGCSAEKDSMTITFTPAPTVDAGLAEVYICQNNAVANLNGSIGIPATTALWSGGAGTYTPNAATLNASYTPTATEISNANQIILTLTTTGATTCNEVSDQIIVKFNLSPIVDVNVNVAPLLAISVASGVKVANKSVLSVLKYEFALSQIPPVALITLACNVTEGLFSQDV